MKADKTIKYFCGIDLAASPSHTRVCVLRQLSSGKLSIEISPRTFNLRGDDWDKEFERLNEFYKTRLKKLLRNPKVSVVIAMDVPFVGIERKGFV